MANSFGIPAGIEKKIRERDIKCVYCGKKFKVYPHGTPNDRAEMEHLNKDGPFYWNKLMIFDSSLVAICCGKCNRSRGNKLHLDWFKTKYCKENKIKDKVVEPVKKYIRTKKYLQIFTVNQFTEPLKNFIENSKWVFAKTMPEIPHEYIKRDDLSEDNQKLFDVIDWIIKKNGYSKEFYSKQYTYFNIDNYKYWVIGNILNRAILEGKN